MLEKLSSAAAFTLALHLAGCATPSVPETRQGVVASTVMARDELGFATSLGEAGDFAIFEPAPTGTTAQIDYTVITEWLDAVVIETGPSTRKRPPNPQPVMGTAIKHGHDSKVRFEGNKIPFSLLKDEVKLAVLEYADSLVEIGNQVDLTTLSRDEQLSYWLNLHNILIIAEITRNYPVKHPRSLTYGEGKVPLHDAKLITIKGVDLSLRDIRRNIVYRYWKDPKVMYGFFYGDLSSPKILQVAWQPYNLSAGLGHNAKEFVNSLRGVEKMGGQLSISPHYYEARAGLFPNWPSDVRAHLADYAAEEVAVILSETAGKPPRARKYEARVADLIGGDPYEPMMPVTDTAGRYAPGSIPQLQDMVTGLNKKFEYLQKSGRLKSSVTIIDVDTDE